MSQNPTPLYATCPRCGGDGFVRVTVRSADDRAFYMGWRRTDA
jgi:hypothetical protein